MSFLFDLDRLVQRVLSGVCRLDSCPSKINLHSLHECALGIVG